MQGIRQDSLSYPLHPLHSCYVFPIAFAKRSA
jgi:hypothetical protein